MTKHGHLKGFGASAVLYLSFFLHVFFPFSFFGFLVHFSPQSFSVWNSSVSSQSYPFLFFVPFVTFCASAWCLLNVAIEVGECGWSKQNNQLSVFIISGISCSVQSNGLKRMVTRRAERQVIPGLFKNNLYLSRSLIILYIFFHKDFPQLWFPQDVIDIETCFVSDSVFIHDEMFVNQKVVAF